MIGIRTIFIFILSLPLAVNAIEIEQFAKTSDVQQLVISPDGKSLAASIINDSGAVIAFFDTQSLKPLSKITFSYSKRPGTLYWVNEERIVFKLLQKKAWKEQPEYYGQLYGVGKDGKKAQLIYGYNAGENSIGPSARQRRKSIAGWADILDLLPEDREHILIQSTPYTDDDSGHPMAMTLNVYSGIIKYKGEVSPIPASNLFVDNLGSVRLAVGTDEKNRKEVRRFDPKTKAWGSFFDSQFGELFYPLVISAEENALYAVDNLNADRTGIYRIDLSSGERQLLFRDKDVSITNALITTDNKRLLAARFDPQYPTYAIFPDETDEHQVYHQMLTTFPKHAVDITSRTKNGEAWIVRVSSDINPGSYYLYNKKENRLKLLFSRLSHIPPKQLSPLQAIKFKSRDGLTIHGYLTIPQSSKATIGKNLPFVVLPHGGPHGVRDYWQYNSEVQALASQGYGVLQVNYRGSSGYGQSFRKSGYHEWGRNIQRDIIDATHWLIKNQFADSERICIMGGSFGAYSAVQSAIIEPDLYQCIIANVGIYDLELLYDEDLINDYIWGKAFLDMAIGNDPQQLKAYSPLSGANKLKSPVLLAHGEKDQRAPIEHAEFLKERLEQNNHPFEWFVKESEGHGFYSDKNNAEYLRKVADFLKRHIGTQSKPE